MGTWGLLIVKHKCKYFIYHNQYDGYPEDLGAEIVKGIPTDWEEYQRWLETQRSTYSILATRLDEKVLTITDDDMTPAGRKDRSYHNVDDRLWKFPSVLPHDILLKEDRQFTYTIDLDREVFTVDHGAHFKLNAIPRERMIGSKDFWVKCLDMDEYGRQTVSARLCPEDSIGCPALKQDQYQDIMEVSEYRDVYSWLDCSIVDAKSTFNIDRPDAHAQILSGILFERFYTHHRSLFEILLLQWSPNDFVFREVAYAVISLAAGQFFLFSENQYDGNFGDGYLTLPLNPATEKSVPEFAMGCHRPGELPGSAPDTNMYWFEGVLISLEFDLTDRETREAAIARAVEFGLQEGKLHFHVVICSILDIVLVQVYFNPDRTPNVKHTPPLNLFNIEHIDLLSTNPLSRPSVRRTVPIKERLESGQPLESADTLAIYFPAFTALTNFLDTAITSALKPITHPNHGIFPAEIYHRILSHVDDMTYTSVSFVSRPLRAYCRQNVRFGVAHTMTAFHSPMNFTMIDNRTSKSELWIGRRNEESKTHGWDRQSGKWYPCEAHPRGVDWHKFPIIGLSTGRLSFLSNVSVVFSTPNLMGAVRSQYDSGGVVKRLKNIPIEGYTPTYRRLAGSELHPLDPGWTPGVMEKKWGEYLFNFFPVLETVPYLCVLPAGVRELRLTRARRREVIWVFLRTAGFETEEAGLLDWICVRLRRKGIGDVKVLVVSAGVVKFFRFVFGKQGQLVPGWGEATEQSELEVGDWHQREAVTKVLQIAGASMRDKDDYLYGAYSRRDWFRTPGGSRIGGQSYC